MSNGNFRKILEFNELWTEFFPPFLLKHKKFVCTATKRMNERTRIALKEVEGLRKKSVSIYLFHRIIHETIVSLNDELKVLSLQTISFHI